MELKREVRENLQLRIKTFAQENWDESFGDLKAHIFLDFVIKELAPIFYNQGVKKAGDWLQGKLLDMDGDCFIDKP